MIRAADMVLFIVDPFQDGHFDVLYRELHNAGLRLNEERPRFHRALGQGRHRRPHHGGTNPPDARGDGRHHPDLRLHQRHRDLASRHHAEQIVDALAMNRVYEKAVVAINKIDIATEEQIQHAESMLPNDWPIMRISAFKEQGLEELKDFIYDNLGFMRIFLKPQGGEADLEEPLIVKDTSTVETICSKLHRDFVRKFRYAKVKGPSAEFDWQRVGLDHLLKDGDLLTIVVKR